MVAARLLKVSLLAASALCIFFSSVAGQSSADSQPAQQQEEKADKSAADAGEPVEKTGVVSDTMCKVKHMEKGDAQCTRMCIKDGFHYSLIVRDSKDKTAAPVAYRLKTSSPEQNAFFDKHAAQRVTVKGKLTGTRILVESVLPAQSAAPAKGLRREKKG